MEEVKASLKTAETAKDKGFKWPTTYGYTEEGELFHREYIPHDFNSRGLISAPTQSLLQKWLREVYSMHIEILVWVDDTYSGQLVSDSFENDNQDEYEAWGEKSYEDALEICLFDALNLIPNNE